MSVHVEREHTVYRGNEYILYSSYIYSDGLSYVNICDGTPLGKCIGCLYDGIGNEYGTYAVNFKYIFSLNERDTTYTTCELFDNHKAIVLVENISKKDVCIKIEPNNKQKIDSHCIFNMHDIMIKLLFNSLPTLSIKDYINIIKMIVTFGRVNSLCYEASKEIKAKVISCLESLVPSYGIETFRITPEVGKLYTFMFAERVMYKYKQRKDNRYFGIKNTMRYVGMFISHEQIGYRDNAEHTYTFQKGEETIKIRLDYNGRSCFNHVEECNIYEDPCEIICTSNNKKQSEEFFEREHLKHQCNIRIYRYLNMMIDKNVNKQELDEAKNEAIESIKKLWYINQPNQIKNY